MYTREELFEEDYSWYGFSDAVEDATIGVDVSSVDDAMYIFDGLPEDIKSLAYMYGLNDTVFREAVYEYFDELDL